MKQFKFTINGNNYDVDVQCIEGNIADIEVNGTPYKVEIHREVKKVATPKLIREKIPTKKSDTKIKKQSSNTLKVSAPLPGNILNVLVKEGDTVKKDDKLLVMEAMKMENNVLAEKEGTVSSIKVAVGDSVLQGDVLIEIE